MQKSRLDLISGAPLPDFILDRLLSSDAGDAEKTQGDKGASQIPVGLEEK
jgi:hypothetical protein